MTSADVFPGGRSDSRDTAAASRLRLAVIGCGAVTERYHLPALLASTDVEIVAFVDPAVSRAQALASGVPGAMVAATHREVAGRADVALVAVPNAWHEAVAIDLLRAGIHVLVEKPMARSVAECDRMCAAAHAGGALLAVGHDFRFFPVADFARRLFASGGLGRVLSVDVKQSTGTGWPSVSSAALGPESGGGVLMGFGVHTLDLLLWWLGDLKPLAYRDDKAGGVEAECECELMLANGAPVHVELTGRRTMRDTAIVECERARVEIGIFEPAIVRLTFAPDAPSLDAQLPDPVFDEAPLRTVFRRQLTDFVAAIRAGRQPLVGAEEGRRVVALVEACYALRQPLRRPWDFPEAYESIRTAVRR